MTPSIILNGSHLLESSTDPIEMKCPDEIPADKKLKSKQSILRKRVQNIGLLDYELERKCREQQLSKVLRALLFVESKLKNEQMIIRKQLCEKDDVINRQLCTIRNLKRKYGELEEEDDPDGTKGISDVAQFCPKCRKNYYLYDSKSIGVQTTGTTESRDEELNNENSSIQSVEYMSSSEEADSFNSFLGARRSRKYTSKRSFKDYLNNKTSPNNTRDFSSSERSFYAESNTTNKHDSDKENNLSESNYGSTGTESIYSNFINSMHGIKTPVSPVKSILNETFSSNGSSKNETFDETVIYGNASNNKNGDENKITEKENEQDCDTSQKYTKDMEVKQGVEPSEDWYASASDMDEGTDNGFSKVYGQSAGNPVLDCVNQILLQDNNDCFTEKDEYPSKSPSTPRSKRVHFSNQNTIHTDSQIANRAPYPIMEQDDSNSQQQQQNFHYDVPIHYTNDYEALGSSNHYVDMESKTGSDDMGNELQSSTDKDQFQQRGIKTPPALPPKPANLIRLQKQLFARPIKLTSRSPNSKGSPSTVTGDGSEPDYCSISDVKETKTVQIVAEIHKEDCNDYSSVVNDNNNQVISEDGDSEDLEESFEDVPKLPMVQEIVPPKKKDMNKFIGLDNYITKSPYKYQAIRSSLSNRQKIAQILAEITKSSPTSNRTSPSNGTTPTYDSPVNIPIVSPMSEVIDQNSDTNEQQLHLPHKSAFDWYHKETLSKRPSIIHEEPPENEDGETNGNQEQNEDNQQEFDYDDSSKIERPSDPITQDPIFYTGDEGEDFRKLSAKQGVLFKNMLALAETPAKLKSDKNYQFFLENSGLSSKPILPRKKRVYYTGPFV
uniref:CSON005303 protein n=1 Tax=Culicoides sonorensis TaxID=179676 RepID=A0A336MWT0_CULSO